MTLIYVDEDVKPESADGCRGAFANKANKYSFVHLKKYLNMMSFTGNVHTDPNSHNISSLSPDNKLKDSKFLINSVGYFFWDILFLGHSV